MAQTVFYVENQNDKDVDLLDLNPYSLSLNSTCLSISIIVRLKNYLHLKLLCYRMTFFHAFILKNI